MTRVLIFSIVVTIFIGSCTPNLKKNNTPTVTVSIIPQKYFVNQIAGDWLKVNVMVKPGYSPASYEPTPQQMMELENSIAYFQIGHIGFEKAWMEKLSSVNSAMKIVDTSKDLELLTEDESCHDHSHDDHHHHHGVNPHIWLSPDMVKHQAKIIHNSLVNWFPEKRDTMEINYKNFVTKIDSVKLELDKHLSGKAGTNFIVYHPVWTYLANDYGLNEISIEENGKEATPDRLKEIIDLAKENEIKVIFVQKEFSDIQAKTIADEIGGEVVQLNPLAYNWFEIMTEFSEVFSSVYGDSNN